MLFPDPPVVGLLPPPPPPPLAGLFVMLVVVTVPLFIETPAIVTVELNIFMSVPFMLET